LLVLPDTLPYPQPHLPYDKRQSDAENAHLSRWLEFADVALEKRVRKDKAA
jgi:hypothetical protein